MLTTSRDRPVTFAETAASSAAILLILALAWHGFVVHFCLGSCAAPTTDQIVVYRLLASALAVAVVTALVVAARRGASWALLWHLGVALGAGLTAAVFAVPSIDLQELREPAPVEHSPGAPPCHSGPPHDCVGG